MSLLLDHIFCHNYSGMELGTVLFLCPRNIAVAQAKRLDEERSRSKIKSDLDGIPVILKAVLKTCS